MLKKLVLFIPGPKILLLCDLFFTNFCHCDTFLNITTINTIISLEHPANILVMILTLFFQQISFTLYLLMINTQSNEVMDVLNKVVFKRLFVMKYFAAYMLMAVE